MALTGAEPRLAPLGNTFVWDARPRDRKRSHSHSGYTPHHIWMLHDGPEPGSEHCADSPCAAAFASEASTVAPESTPELWPDTDSDDEEEYEWSPCSRSGRGQATAPARAQTAGEGWSRHAACGASPPQVLATTPAGCAACLPATAVPSAPVLPLAGTPLRTPPGAASPLGAVGQSLTQVPAPPWPAMLTTPPSVPTLQGPHWFGGQLFVPMVSPGARVADSLESAMLAAESALAGLEAAEDEAAMEAAAAASEGEVAMTSPQARKSLPAGVTSLMLRSLPREVTQRKLLDDVSRSGFAGKCDFCYMPRDFASGENLGHAFVNFISHAAAVEFHRAWHGRPCCADRAVGESGIDISVAALQGLAANAAKWDSPRMRRVRNPDFKPFVLEGGAAGCPCGKLPRATRAI